MSLKEAGKEIAAAGLSALLLNPLVLLILLIVGVALLAISIGLVIYYGLVTAITFFVLGTAVLLVLHYVKAINIEKQPYIALAPFAMAAIGYIGERLQVFSVQPLWITSTPQLAGGEWLFIVLLILFLAVIAGRRKT